MFSASLSLIRNAATRSTSAYTQKSCIFNVVRHLNTGENSDSLLPTDQTWRFLDRILRERAGLAKKSDMKTLWEEMSRRAHDEVLRRPPAGPYAGRSVRVDRGDTGQAYIKLAGILSRNRVVRELRRAERHEKKGVKRRRLASDRWRRYFANEVRKKVQLVAAIQHRNKYK